MSGRDVSSVLLCWAGVNEETSAKNLLTSYSSSLPRPVSREFDNQQQLAISCLCERRRFIGSDVFAPAADGSGCVKKKREIGERVGGA